MQEASVPFLLTKLITGVRLVEWFLFFFSSAIVLGSRKRLKIVCRCCATSKRFLFSPLGPLGGREVRSSGNVAHPLVQLPRARPGWRAELGMAAQGSEVLTERGFPGWGPLFAVIFVLESISSPLPFGPSSQPWFTWAKDWLSL